MEFVDEREQTSLLDVVTLTPHEEVRRTIKVIPGRDDIARELGEMDSAVFVARIEGVGDISEELTPPW